MKCDSEDRVFKLSKQDVAALVEFASTDKTRTSLTCVRFEPEQGTAIATDGHAIVVAKNCGTYREDAFSVPLAADGLRIAVLFAPTIALALASSSSAMAMVVLSAMYTN
jgi:hypothetical protein